MSDNPSTMAGLDLQFAGSGSQPYARRALRDVRLQQAASALSANRLEICRLNLAEFLRARPKDADALNLMAELVARMGQNQKAESLLAQCIEYSPDFDGARFNYANALYRLNKPDQAIAQLDMLLEKEPANLPCRNLKALFLATQGKDAEAVDCYCRLAEDFPGSAEIWTHYGHALRIKGLSKECVAAYRKAIDISPSFGIAWSSLAHLKTYRFDEIEIDRMQSALSSPDLRGENRADILFALGKAYADRNLYDKAFENYSKGNAIRRISIDYDPDAISARFSEFKAFFTREFFEARAGVGCDVADPIFILGMHRSGSTLVEQILASHSAIEGAGELPDIPALAAHLESEVSPSRGSSYPEVLNKLDPGDFRAMGELYLQNTRARRKLGRKFFIDKCPYNLWNVGLIHLILPNARIIDTRRHPLGCCFSNFTMNFTKGMPYFFRQAELGRYYADYVDLMAHFDRALPGKVHRVNYENLVDDLESEVRRMLDYLGLPFEEACLSFHQNDRSVSTLSSEQVRKPIFRQGVEEWQNYEQWLGPLKAALGPVLEAYPDPSGIKR